MDGRFSAAQQSGHPNKVPARSFLSFRAAPWQCTTHPSSCTWHAICKQRLHSPAPAPTTWHPSRCLLRVSALSSEHTMTCAIEVMDPSGAASTITVPSGQEKDLRRVLLENQVGNRPGLDHLQG